MTMESLHVDELGDSIYLRGLKYVDIVFYPLRILLDKHEHILKVRGVKVNKKVSTP